MTIIKDIAFYLVLASITCATSYWLESNYLFDYLRQNILGLLLTLLAINTATSGLIASKLQDALANYPQLDLKGPIEQMKISLLEQIVLLIVSIAALTILTSAIIIWSFKDQLLNMVLTTVLIYSVGILWDTGKAVFVVIECIQNIKKK